MGYDLHPCFGLSFYLNRHSNISLFLSLLPSSESQLSWYSSHLRKPKVLWEGGKLDFRFLLRVLDPIWNEYNRGAVSSFVDTSMSMSFLFIFVFVVRMAAPGVQKQVAYTPPAKIVGNVFTTQYYQILEQSPALVYRFYQDIIRFVVPLRMVLWALRPLHHGRQLFLEFYCAIKCLRFVLIEFSRIRVDRKNESAPNYTAYCPFSVNVFLSPHKIEHIARFVDLPAVNSPVYKNTPTTAPSPGPPKSVTRTQKQQLPTASAPSLVLVPPPSSAEKR